MYNLKNLLEGFEYEANVMIADDAEISEVVSDSKKVTPGCLFVCFKGMKSDPHEFIDDVIRRGCLVIICEKNCDYVSKNAIIIRVSEVRSVYARIFGRICGNPEKRLKLIAVTGTNGKTTVTNMIHSALVHMGKKAALIGTLGGYFEGERTSVGTMTTPDPEVLYPLLQRYAELGAEYAVMEVSSHALALCKADGLHFAVAAMTNLTPEHLDFHGNMYAYSRAKEKLFEMSEIGVFCVDDEYTERISSKCGCKTAVKCSVRSARCDIYASDVSFKGLGGVVFSACENGEKTEIFSTVPGEFTVSNALLAFSVMRSLGFSGRAAALGIASLKSVIGRMEVLDTDTEYTVIIDFAHTPDALEKLIKSVRTLCGEERRIVTLFGCGGDRDKSKRALMGRVASELSDQVILTSDNSRSEDVNAIIDQICDGISNKCRVIRVIDRRSATRYALENARAEDVILLCGKGHEEYEIDSKGIRPYSERKIVAEILKELSAKSALEG